MSAAFLQLGLEKAWVTSMSFQAGDFWSLFSSRRAYTGAHYSPSTKFQKELVATALIQARLHKELVAAVAAISLQIGLKKELVDVISFQASFKG